MKALMVALTVFTMVSCLTSCGGASQEDKSASEKFSRDLLRKIGKTWTLNEIDDDQIASGADKHDFNLKIANLKTAAGDIKEIKNPTVKNSRENENGSVFIAHKFKVQCEKTLIETTIGLIKPGKDWTLFTLDIRSLARDQLIEKETEETAKIAEEVVRKVYTDFDASYLESLLTKNVKTDLKNADYSLAELMKFLQEEYGKIKEVKHKELTGYGVLNGNLSYFNKVDIECEKGTADNTITSVKEDGEWKVDYYSFGVKSVKDVDPELKTEAMQEALGMIQNIQKNYELKYFKSILSKSLTEAIKSKGDSPKIVLEKSKKEFGKLLKINKHVFGGCDIENKKKVYQCYFEIDSENGPAKITYSLIKEDDQWKLFDLQGFLDKQSSTN